MFALRLVIFALNDVNSAADSARIVLIGEIGLDKLDSGLLGVAFNEVDGRSEILLNGEIGDVLDAAAALNAAGLLDSPVRRARKLVAA